MRRTPGEDNPVISLAIAFEMDSFLDKYSKIFIVFGEHRSFISVHLIVTLSLLIATYRYLSLLIATYRYFIAIDFFCILAPGYCAEYKIVHEILNREKAVSFHLTTHTINSFSKLLYIFICFQIPGKSRIARKMSMSDIIWAHKTRKFSWALNY